jgi:hypothetical protein
MLRFFADEDREVYLSLLRHYAMRDGLAPSRVLFDDQSHALSRDRFLNLMERFLGHTVCPPQSRPSLEEAPQSQTGSDEYG